MNGKVYLVGAGPGDPEMLTLKALKVLGRADAVLHDDLVSPQILAKAPKAAVLYNVGKRSGQTSTRQQAIHFLMIELARQGLNVVRLKGGDPMIFGRAGEEIRALREAGVEFEVVPGVTSALAAAAAAQISLTMRETASSLLILTGHFADGAADDARSHGCSTDNRPLPDLRALLAAGTTIALYMPGADSRITVRRLAAAGVELDTPVALIARATLPDQQIIRTTLEKLPQAPSHLKPSILVIGDVARLSKHDQLRLAGMHSQTLGPQASIDQPQIGVERFDSRLSGNGVNHG